MKTKTWKLPKPEKVDGKTTTNIIQLTEADKKRITNEVEILTKRV